MTDEVPLADVDPKDVTGETVEYDAVRAAFDHEDAQVRQRGLAVAEAVAADDLAALDPLVPDLAALLADDHQAIAQRAGGLLVPVANQQPARLTGHVPEILPLLDLDLGGHRLVGAKLLAAVVLEDADAVAPHFGAIVDALAATDTDVTSDIPEDATIDEQALETIRRHEADEQEWRVVARDTLSNVVVAVVEEAPGTVADEAADVAALLDHGDETIVANAVDALAAWAQHDPAIVEPYVEDLRGLLARDDEVIRARAIRALGFSGADEAVDDLERVADEDPEPDVRELAAETVAYLDEQ